MGTAMPPLVFPKTRLLRALKAGEAVPVPELIARLPEFTWRELFLTIRALNRQGAIRLHRNGYDFAVSSLPTPSGEASTAACAHSR
jgi:hypothetical protein